MELLDLSGFNVVVAYVSGFCCIYCIVSDVLKSRFFISEPLPATLFGVIFGVVGWLPESDHVEISLAISRVVLGIQLFVLGTELPGKYLKHTWSSISMLLIVVMTVMWIASSLVIFLCIPGLSFLESLIIGACITPTDPVLSGSLTSGTFALQYLDQSLRDLIVAESGANDGFGYPFLFLAVSIYKYSGGEIAKQWLLYTIVYEILLSIAYGVVIGTISQYTLSYALRARYIDRNSYHLFQFVVALFIMGTAGLIGTDDLFACFIAGSFLNWNDEYRLKTHESEIQGTVDLFLNLIVFFWIGASTPWKEFNNHFAVWHYIVMGIAIMVFRRLPILVVTYKFIPVVKDLQEAIFMGYFGPIGVGALYYLQISINTLENVEKAQWIRTVIEPVVYFCIICSIICHGISIFILRFVFVYFGYKS